MCGIIGIINQTRPEVPAALLNCMRDTLARRGPDGEGSYVEGSVGMAMRRLSIIDIEGGQQPFFSRNRSVVAFQNGEIYNHLSLKRNWRRLAFCSSATATPKSWRMVTRIGESTDC